MPASGDAIAFSTRDEIEGTTTYYVYVRSTTYEDFTNENQIELKCLPSREIYVDWHRGGRHSGAWGYLHGTEPDVTYRFDDQAPRKWNETLGDYARYFTTEIAKGKVLVMKTALDSSTTKFLLTGTTAALNKGFAQQCDLFDKPAEPEETTSAN
jgi:hypothetical protein